MTIDWSNVTGTDVITAGSAVVSAIVAFLLWRVTSKYTTETGAIARANDRMAAANDRMAASNEALITEMLEDRRLNRRRRSEDAARRLQIALAGVERRWAPADRETMTDTLRDIYNDWTETIATDHNVIINENVRIDINRFTSILFDGATNWDALIGTIEDEQGAREAEMRQRLDNRPYRLNAAARELREVLGRHQRDEDLDEPLLPVSSKAFWTTPAGAFDADFDVFR